MESARMVMNEYLDKKLRVLNMHDEEPKICLMVTEKQKINIQFKSIKDETRKIYTNKKKQPLYILLILTKISQD